MPRAKRKTRERTDEITNFHAWQLATGFDLVRKAWGFRPEQIIEALPAMREAWERPDVRRRTIEKWQYERARRSDNHPLAGTNPFTREKFLLVAPWIEMMIAYLDGVEVEPRFSERTNGKAAHHAG